MAQQEMAVLVQRQAAKYGDRAALKLQELCPWRMDSHHVEGV